MVDVKRIWRKEELGKELYYDPISKVKEFEEKNNDSVADKLNRFLKEWNEEIKGELNLELIQLIGDDKKQASWEEWTEYFQSSLWENVFILYDEELHTGTLILYNHKGGNLKGTISKDISWSLFKVFSYMKDKKYKIKMHSISYVVIDDFKDKDSAIRDSKGFISEIINGIEQRSELLHEAKLTLIDKCMIVQYDRQDWESNYLANHLISIRKNRLKFEKTKVELTEKIESKKEKLNSLKGRIEAFMFKEKLSASFNPEIEKIYNHLNRLSEKRWINTVNKLKKIDSFFVGIKFFTKNPFILELKEKLNVIYAPNGYGKSTVVDGLKNMVIGVNQDLAENASPLWNIRDKKSIGVFGIVQKIKDTEEIQRIICQLPDKSIEKSTYIKKDDYQKEDKNLDINLDLDHYKLFCYSGALKYTEEMVYLLILLMTNFDLNEIPQIASTKVKDEIVHDFIQEFEIITTEIKQEIENSIQENLSPLLTTLTTVMTADSWLYDLRYQFSVEKGLVIAEEEKIFYSIEQVLNMGEQKIVNISIFFLLYYLEGHKYSDVIILDDIFDTFDERQCYNLLRFIMTFRNLPQMKDKQIIILSHRKGIFDYFYYGYLRYLNENKEESIEAGYYNFVMQKEFTGNREKYKLYINKLGSKLDDLDILEIPSIKER
ncbi:MAG: hypothetical protein KAX49_02100 [Halanaerobiales bacterium]|nr:hypothetical protein [Halanaerobiales bacterium]